MFGGASGEPNLHPPPAGGHPQRQRGGHDNGVPDRISDPMLARCGSGVNRPGLSRPGGTRLAANRRAARRPWPPRKDEPPTEPVAACCRLPADTPSAGVGWARPGETERMGRATRACPRVLNDQGRPVARRTRGLGRGQRSAVGQERGGEILGGQDREDLVPRQPRPGPTRGWRTSPWMPMTAGGVVTGDADSGCALRWFVGVSTSPTKRQPGPLTTTSNSSRASTGRSALYSTDPPASSSSGRCSRRARAPWSPVATPCRTVITCPDEEQRGSVGQQPEGCPRHPRIGQ